MPTYSYRCTACSNAFDIQQSFADDSLTVCEPCGGMLRKVFSPVGIAFKGSGFYRTDSGAGGRSPKPAESSDGGRSTESAAATQSSTSTTPSPAATSSSTGQSVSASAS